MERNTQNIKKKKKQAAAPAAEPKPSKRFVRSDATPLSNAEVNRWISRNQDIKTAISKYPECHTFRGLRNSIQILEEKARPYKDKHSDAHRLYNVKNRLVNMYSKADPRRNRYLSERSNYRNAIKRYIKILNNLADAISHLNEELDEKSRTEVELSWYVSSQRVYDYMTTHIENFEIVPRHVADVPQVKILVYRRCMSDWAADRAMINQLFWFRRRFDYNSVVAPMVKEMYYADGEIYIVTSKDAPISDYGWLARVCIACNIDYDYVTYAPTTEIPCSIRIFDRAEKLPRIKFSEEDTKTRIKEDHAQQMSDHHPKNHNIQKHG